MPRRLHHGRIDRQGFHNRLLISGVHDGAVAEEDEIRIAARRIAVELGEQRRRSRANWAIDAACLERVHDFADGPLTHQQMVRGPRLEALAAALEANRKAIGNRERFTSTDIAFHFELAKMARNPVFIALHDQISEWLKEQRTVTLAAKGQEKTAFEAHKAIYEGIAARDPDRAEQAMRTHLEQLAVTFWQQRTHD